MTCAYTVSAPLTLNTDVGEFKQVESFQLNEVVVIDEKKVCSSIIAGISESFWARKRGPDWARADPSEVNIFAIASKDFWLS